MPLILNIDTSTEIASISLTKDGSSLQIIKNEEQKDHAKWLHPAIEQMVSDAGYQIKNLDAVAVASGPGSYTGLRVGMAAAKGLCYALDIPLITENTLKLMAFSVQQQAQQSALLICPMIDARRLEVFTAVYNHQLEALMAPAALILDGGSFQDFLIDSKTLFLGSGTKKWKPMIANNPNALFTENPPLAASLGKIAQNKYVSGSFADLVYSEPIYIKEFFTHEKK